MAVLISKDPERTRPHCFHQATNGFRFFWKNLLEILLFYCRAVLLSVRASRQSDAVVVVDVAVAVVVVVVFVRLAC